MLLLMKLSEELYAGREKAWREVGLLEMPAHIRKLRRFVASLAKKGPRSVQRGAEKLISDIDRIGI